jgi:uncharacterized protein YndB with AHSA1/START domain
MKKSESPEGADASALVITRVVDASPATAFSLWGKAEYAKRWWQPRGFTTPAFEMDFRVGGTYRYCIRSRGKDSWAHGTYREIIAPERLVFTFQWESGDAAHDAETLITVTFEPQAGKTLITFRQEPFKSLADRDSHAEGWSEVLERLGEVLATHPIE